MTRPIPGTRAWLVATGLIDEDGVNAKPRPRRCRSCGTLGWAAWVDGVGPAVLVDPIALTPLGELQVIMAGRQTYTHWFDGIDYRRAYWIRRIPASKTNIIRPGHKCEKMQFDHYPEMKPIIERADNDTIPF